MTRLLCFLTVLGLLLPRTSAAQTASDKATAEALFESARQLLQDGRYAEACPKFEASQKLDAGLGTLLFLGECYEKMGKVASAWATFREADSLARGRGDEARAAVARQRALDLEPRLPKLSIAVAPGNPGDLAVKRDGNVVPRETWGLAVPVDPGEHVIEATAPGKEPWSRSMVVTGEATSTSVDVPVLTDAASAPGAEQQTVTESAEPSAPATEPEPVAVDEGSGQRTVGVIVGVVGLGGIAVGSIFGLKAKSDNDESKDFCAEDDENRCNAQGTDLRQDAQDAALVSTLGFGIGAAALVTGAVLYFTAPSGRSEAKARALRVSADLGPRSAGMTLGGRF